MGVKFGPDGNGVQEDEGLHHVWTRAGAAAGAAGGVGGGGGGGGGGGSGGMAGACACIQFRCNTFKGPRRQQALGEPEDTGAVWVYLAGERWMLARFQQSCGYYGFHVFSKVQADPRLSLLEQEGEAEGFEGLWTPAFPSVRDEHGRDAAVHLKCKFRFDCAGEGESCGGETHIHYRFKKEAEAEKPERPKKLMFLFEKSMALIDGTTLTSRLQEVAAHLGDGLMCLSVPGTPRALLLRREGTAKREHVKASLTPWDVLTLHLGDRGGVSGVSGLKALVAKHDSAGQLLEWREATQARAAHLVLNPLSVDALWMGAGAVAAVCADADAGAGTGAGAGVGAGAGAGLGAGAEAGAGASAGAGAGAGAGGGWWPAVVAKAEQQLVGGSPAQRLWAYLLLAAAASSHSDCCSISVSTNSSSSNSSSSNSSKSSSSSKNSSSSNSNVNSSSVTSSSSSNVTSCSSSSRTVALAAVGALTMGLSDAHPMLRQTAEELLQQLAGLEGVAASPTSNVSFIEVDVPCLGPAEQSQSCPSACSRLPARLEVRQAAGESLMGGMQQPQQPQPRVLLVSPGSRGDVEPLLLLAQRLKAHGCSVKAVVSSNFVELCSHYGIPAVAAWCNLAAAFKRAGGLGEGGSHPQLRDCFEAGARAEAANLTHPRLVLESFKPDVTVLSLGGRQSASKAYRWEDELGVPCIQAVGASVSLTALEQQRDALPRLWQLPSRPVLVHTSRFLDSERPPQGGPLQQTGCWLDTSTSEPSAAALAKEPLASLAAFLAAGPPPIAITWGSMVPKVPSLALLVRALMGVRGAGRRAVVLGGWAKLDASGRMLAGGIAEADAVAMAKVEVEAEADADAAAGAEAKAGAVAEAEAGAGGDCLAGLCSERERDVKAVLADPDALARLRDFVRQRCCFVDAAPHLWLFRQCYCTLHHGGAGTTHASLYAGRPCLIAPVSFDQPHWASRVEAQRVGKALPHVEQLRAWHVRAAIEEVGGFVEAAEKLSEKMRAEAGLQGAAEALFAFLRAHRSGSWQSRREILLAQAVQPNCTLM